MVAGVGVKLLELERSPVAARVSRRFSGYCGAQCGGGIMDARKSISVRLKILISTATRVAGRSTHDERAKNSHYVGAAKSCQVELTQSHAGTEPLGRMIQEEA